MDVAAACFSFLCRLCCEDIFFMVFNCMLLTLFLAMPMLSMLLAPDNVVVDR